MALPCPVLSLFFSLSHSHFILSFLFSFLHPPFLFSFVLLFSFFVYLFVYLHLYRFYFSFCSLRLFYVYLSPITPVHSLLCLIFYQTPSYQYYYQNTKVLDFSAIHLSSFERYTDHLPRENKRQHKIDSVQKLLEPSVAKLIELSKKGLENRKFKQSFGEETLVMIPYFAQVQWRQAESILQNRPLYLNATYYSLITHFPGKSIMVAVQNDIDYDFIMTCGLLLKAVVKVTVGTSGHTKLPVAMLQEVISRIEKKDVLMKDVKYVFYCEAGASHRIAISFSTPSPHPSTCISFFVSIFSILFLILTFNISAFPPTPIASTPSPCLLYTH